jgi:hypothetical protein
MDEGRMRRAIASNRETREDEGGARARQAADPNRVAP